MAKTVQGYSGTTYGSNASNGSQPVVFTPAKHSDGSAVKDPNK